MKAHGIVLLVTFGVMAGIAQAQNLLPPLSAWQAGQDGGVPADWNVKAAVSRTTIDGKPVLAVHGTGEDSAFWRTPDLVLPPGSAYVFRFRARADGSGTIISGSNLVNRDFGPSSKWQEYSFAFRVPEATPLFARVGHWHVKGTVYFDRVEMYPAQVVHRRWGELELGEGERLRTGEYVDTHQPGWYGSNIHRTLWRQRAYLNTNRWVLSPGDEVVYRYTLPFPMRSAVIRANINYYTSGTVVLSASTDGENWQSFARGSRVELIEAPLPETLFPTKQLFVRIQVEGNNAYAQVDYVRLQAKTDYRGAERTGNTLIVEERQTSPSLKVQWQAQDTDWKLRWTNRNTRSLPVEVAIGINGRWTPIGKLTLPAGATKDQPLALPGLPAGKQVVQIRATTGRTSLYSAQFEVTRMVLDESHYGYPLQASPDFGEVWWCEGAWKVGRNRPSPIGKPSAAVLIEAARGEFEPAQVVLRAKHPNTVLQGVTVSDLKSTRTTIPASQVKLFEVATVQVEHPSDNLGTAGEYPDPLPPLQTPFTLPHERNQAIWILVHVPESAPAGTYNGTITFQTNRGRLSVPLRVQVFDFSLPKETTLRSGFGLGAWEIERYHHLQTDEQKRTVWDLYMRSFAEHRIAPYSFYAYAPIHVRFEGEGEAKKVIVDFTEFDRAAERYLNEMKFNAFLLPIQGLGGGTFYERYEGEFGGFKAGTPEYERLFGDYLHQIESHLREKGWLEKAYVYWFDEPEPRDYEFVIEGMQRIRRHAPGIRRLLTEQPEPLLYGHVEIWCGLTPEWTKERVAERRKAGEEVWWYICTGPRAPYIGLFIEHPAVEMRLWAWQSWQYGIQGILIWQTNYWTSNTAFPNSLQNPWEDPMSYVTGYGTPVGTKQFWGNGDGRFLYPPRRDPNQQHPPAIQPPISSIRWENLRDGVEDYEYFAILQALVERLQGTAPASLLAEAQKLLEVPEHISKDLTNFTTDPRPLLEHRRKVARMIERLQKLAGGRANYAQEER
ncbi:MAG: DUF4091 domain-containing protein [Chthonomonadetes bacterium]|nr:DUF4091 domain-containing protein [Chthonomonadetes bacterium]